jgi:hypothetical protein
VTEKIKWKATHTNGNGDRLMVVPVPVEGIDKLIAVWEDGYSFVYSSDHVSDYFTPIPDTYTLTVKLTRDELEGLDYDWSESAFSKIVAAARALLEAQ